MKRYIILLISIIIDGMIPNITIYDFNNITYFTPLCTVISLVIIYNDKNFINLFLFSSIVYGSLYMSNILLSFILFIIVLMVIKYLKKAFEDNLFTIILEIILVICIYEFIFFSITSFLYFNNFSFDNYLYKLTHSIIFNLLYGITIYYIYDKNSSKFKH